MEPTSPKLSAENGQLWGIQQLLGHIKTMLCKRAGKYLIHWYYWYILSREYTPVENFRGLFQCTVVLQKVSVIGPLLFLLFENDLQDALKALTRLFADDVKMLTRRAQNTSFHNSLIISGRNRTYRSTLLSAATTQLGEKSSWDYFFPRWVRRPGSDRQCILSLCSVHWSCE